MALHGDIRVNHKRIAEWAAQNTGPNDDGTCTYDCTVWWTNGGPMHKFKLTHNPDDGALTLPRLVLAEAERLEREV